MTDKATTTDELVQHYSAASPHDPVILARAIPAAIDAIYAQRDDGGNMHSAGAAAAVAALDMALQGRKGFV